MKINNIQRLSCLFAVLILFIAGCAKVVAPTGGPKDEDHPLIVKIDPADNSVNFDRKKVEITFNEFIQLKDLNTNLVISPPLEEKPEIQVKGKTLEIEFVGDLKDSTTYNIYMGNSVQDYTEGNSIENFQYVLSTGDFIDSLSISGQVINSFNLLPEEGVFVMLYQDLEDSVPIKQIPLHISKTNEEGFFQINNISNNSFKLFCLRDFNKNYLFDLPNEDIAFVDSLVSFELITETTIDTIYKVDTIVVRDSLVIDSLQIKKEELLPDSLKANEEDAQEIDTIIITSHAYYPVKEYIFRLFTEYHEVQYITNNVRDSKQKIELAFNKPIKDSLKFELVDTVVEHEWFIKEPSTNNDSIIYWVTDSMIYNKEDIHIALSYYKEDTNLVYQWSTDTLKFKFFEQEIKKKKNEEDADTSLNYSMNIKNRGTLNLNTPINFFFETPISTYDTSHIKLFAEIDTIDVPVEFNFFKDSVELREYHLDVEWGADTVYRLEIYPNAFRDVYETANDTNIFQFATQKRDYYGKILANIVNVDSTTQVICQLILPGNDDEKVIREKVIDHDQMVEFDFLPPKEFMFKVVIDKNKNGKWDTGNYLEHIQPEEVLYYDEAVKVRSNWDHEINFDVNK